MITQSTDETTTCEYCNALLQKQTMTFSGRTYGIGYERCDCTEARNFERQKEIEAAREKAEQRTQEILGRYQRAGIKKRFLDAETDLMLDSYYIVGKVGVGKTHIASALAIEAIAEGHSVRFVTGIELLSRIKATFSNNAKETSDQVVKEYSEIDYLIIDDLGKENPTGFAREVMFSIINSRYDNLLPLIVTSNYERDELIKRLGNDIDAIALVSRLSEMCKRYKVEGLDRRLHG